MTNPMAAQIQQLLAEFQEQREKTMELHRKMNEVAVTVRSPKREVSVTCGPGGEVTDITFPTDAYRTMARPEFAALLMKTIGKAAGEAKAEVSGLMSGLGSGFDYAGLQDGTVSMEDLLPDLGKGDDPVFGWLANLGIAPPARMSPKPPQGRVS